MHHHAGAGNQEFNPVRLPAHDTELSQSGYRTVHVNERHVRSNRKGGNLMRVEHGTGVKLARGRKVTGMLHIVDGSTNR